MWITKSLPSKNGWYFIMTRKNNCEEIMIAYRCKNKKGNLDWISKDQHLSDKDIVAWSFI